MSFFSQSFIKELSIRPTGPVSRQARKNLLDLAHPKIKLNIFNILFMALYLHVLLLMKIGSTDHGVKIFNKFQDVFSTFALVPDPRGEGVV